MSRRGYFGRKRQLPQEQPEKAGGRQLRDGRYCVWCKHFMPRQARHKPDLCEECKRQLPLRPRCLNNNLPWMRCVDCDAFMRGDFNFCQECGFETESGKKIILKQRAAAQKLQFELKQQKFEVVATTSKAIHPAGFGSSVLTSEDKMLASIDIEAMVKKFTEEAAARMNRTSTSNPNTTQIKPNDGQAVAARNTQNNDGDDGRGSGGDAAAGSSDEPAKQGENGKD